MDLFKLGKELLCRKGGLPLLSSSRNEIREESAIATTKARRPSVFVFTVLVVETACLWAGGALAANTGEEFGPLLRDPIWVYNNFFAYDENTEDVKLTEELAMKELNEIVRLRQQGARFDYYVIDDDWFEKGSAYRQWRKESWPNGPDHWLAECHRLGIKPGLWFPTNSIPPRVGVVSQWENALGEVDPRLDGTRQASLFEGSYLADLMSALQLWYDRGFRMFKFDFANFDVARAESKKSMSASDIRERNASAFREALKQFRRKNPEVVFVAYNGFGGDIESTAASFPFHDPVDLRWLEVFESMYSGDPRVSDVPQSSFARSMDIYSDHMVRRYEQSYVPLERIDSAGFVLADTGSNFNRKKMAWKNMLLMLVARGGWSNVVYGNLEYLTNDDARWFAKVQQLFGPLQALGRTKTFGGIPGEIEPYGFASLDATGAVYTVINPTQVVQTVGLPKLSAAHRELGRGRIMFRDSGFKPLLKDQSVVLGPGQMALVGFDRHAAPEFDLGIQDEIRIPVKSVPMHVNFSRQTDNTIVTSLIPPPRGGLRIVFQQRDMHGEVKRTIPQLDWKNLPHSLKASPSFGNVFRIEVDQNGRSIPVKIDYDRHIFSGMSWGVGEVNDTDIVSGELLTIRCSSAEDSPVSLEGAIYSVEYLGTSARINQPDMEAVGR